MTTSHITDSRLYGAVFASAPVASVFSDRNRVRKWFEIEAALALAQGERGIIPEAAAEEIARKADADLLGGLLLSERVMLALGEEVGKQTAHEIVHEVAMAAQKKGTGFREELAADPRAAPYLDREAIRGLLDPARYPGLTGRIVDEVAGRSLS